MMDATKKWIERSVNAVSAFVDGCHQAGDSASVEYLRGNLTLGDLRGLLAAVESIPPEVARIPNVDHLTVQELQALQGRLNLLLQHRVLGDPMGFVCTPSPLARRQEKTDG